MSSIKHCFTQSQSNLLNAFSQEKYLASALDANTNESSDYKLQMNSLFKREKMGGCNYPACFINTPSMCYECYIL